MPFIVDAHTHPFAGPNVDLTGVVRKKGDALTLRFRHPKIFQKLRSNMHDVTDLMIADMDAAGVAMAVVQPATGGDIGVVPPNIGGGVDGVIAAVKRNPKRLIGLFTVADDEVVYRRTDKGRVTRANQKEWAQKIKHWVERDSLKGCGEIVGFSRHSAPELIAEDLMPLMEILADHRLPLMVPTAWTQFATALYHGVPFFVDDLAEAFPEVPIIITKMGRGYQFIFEIALAVAYKHVNVYLDTVQAPSEHVTRAVRELGADRVIYGTDWSSTWRQSNLPNGIYPNTLAEIDKAGLSESDKAWVLGKTCAKVYGVSAADA